MPDDLLTSDQRMKLLARLVAGDTVGPALSSAVGGRLSAKAYKTLRATRLVDAELHAACEAAERRANDEVPDKRMGSQHRDLPAAEDRGNIGAEMARVASVLDEVAGTGARLHSTPPRDSVLSALAAQLQPVAPLYEEGRGLEAEPVMDRARREILAKCPENPRYAYLLNVEAKRVAAGMHITDPMWLTHCREFYASGKVIDVGRFGVRAAKSDTCCTLVASEVAWVERTLQPGVIGVCPIMSSSMREAKDRFDTVKVTLRAMGYEQVERAEVGVMQFKTSGGGSQAMVISMLDSQEHLCEFRIYPASVGGAAGFTGIAGFGDEMDLWGSSGGANPAQSVVEVLCTRYTTQPEACLHLMSATYDRKSYHATMIKDGDTPLQRVARIGLNGALKDYECRMRLASLYNLKDDTLCAPPVAETSTDCPTWVFNPAAPIEKCYALAKGDLRRMFGIYGGRPQSEAGGGHSPWCEGLAERNQRLSALARGRSDGRMLDGGARERQPGDRRRLPSGRGRMIG